MGQVAVPLILHAVTLPGGADALWKVLDEDFHSDDWRVRFAAVEKVTVILRFLDDKPVKKSAALRSVLSHAFCCLIACMDDITPHVSQRASVYLGTIHDAAIKTLIWCLEYQVGLSINLYRRFLKIFLPAAMQNFKSIKYEVFFK